MVTRNSDPLILLAADTSSPRGSLALFISHKKNSFEFLEEASWMKDRSHSEVITHNCEKLLKKSNYTIKDINVLAVGNGPGSFTGVRVALNFIRTLAYSFDLPILCFNSLLVLAGPALQKDYPVLCMVNAYKNLIYAASFKLNGAGDIETTIEPQAISAYELQKKINEPHLVVGDGFDVFKPQFSEPFLGLALRNDQFADHPKANRLGDLCLGSRSSTQPIDWEQLRPLYIRESEAEEKLRVGLLKPLPTI